MQDNSQIILIEQTLLNKVITNNEFLMKVTVEDLVSSTAQNLLRAIKTLTANKINLNSRNLTIEVNKIDNIDQQSVQILFNEDLITDDSFDYLYKELKKEKAKFSIKTDILDDLVKEVERKNSFDPEKVQQLTRDLNIKILSIDDDKSNLIMDLGDMFTKYMSVMKARRAGKMFYDTGCSYLNSHLMEGFAPQKITTLFGPSGVGKSSFALYLVNKQINKHIPSIYISLEMDLVSTMDRLIAQRNRINMEHLLPKYSDESYIEDEIFDMIEAEKVKLQNHKNFFFVEQPGLSLSDAEYIIKEVKSRMGVDSLIVTSDLTTMFTDFNKGTNKAASYEHALNFQHEMAKSNNVHFVNVIQGRRPSSKVVVDEPADVEKFRPRIEEIKNSSAFEERSRIIISTFRAKHYVERLLPEHPELEVMEDIMDIDILKQNMGALGRIHYLFNPKRSMILPYIEEIEAPNTQPEDFSE